MADILERERRGRVEVLRLNRPEARNAMSPELSAAIEGALDDIEPDPETAVVVVAGNGPVFCAGADLRVIAAGGGAGIMTKRGGFAGLAQRDYPKPVIAAVHGAAVAGGFELVLACDLVVAADNARFGLPEPRLGLAPGGGGTQRLPRIVGRTRALEVLLAGRVLNGAEAHEWGLATRVVPKEELLAAAEELARTMVALAPAPLATIKRIVDEGMALPLADALTLEQDETAQLIVTPDALEGIAAFVEKREARFPGRDALRSRSAR